MNHNRLYFLLLLFAFSLGIPGLAQKRCISQDWNFCRISDETSKAEIKNQGSDWSSQYNVQHMDMNGNSELAVPQNTLGAELRQLENKQWEQITLPHTPFVEPLTVLHQWQGICYYKKKITITPEEAKKHIWIEFEGAMHLADVWINGKHVMQHAGGYTPFVVDATGLLKTGKENELLVRLDNRNNSLIPPGKPLETLDFCYYGGIYRNVHLIAKADVHITHPILDGHPAGAGIFITYPKVSQELSVVDAKTEIKNTSDKEKVVELRHTLYTWKKQKGKDKKVQNISETLTLHPGVTIENNQRMEVKHPALWSPDEPNLYVLSTEVVENGKVVDKEETRIGIRHIEMSIEKGFVINGKPLRLVGSNRHMEYPYVGNAISDQAQYRDMYQIRSNGFNIVRLGHYPQATAALDACDELGLLAIEPIPGWQFFNKNPLFISLTHRDVRDMIRRDRNHPSIVMWETTLNESWPPAEWRLPMRNCREINVSHQAIRMVIKDLMSVTMTGKKASNVPIIVVNRDLYANIMIMSLAGITAQHVSDGETEKRLNFRTHGMRNGRTTDTVFIIQRQWGMRYGVCMITIGDVAIIFVIVVWPTSLDYLNSVFLFSEHRLRKVACYLRERCLMRYLFRRIGTKFYLIQ